MTKLYSTLDKTFDTIEVLLDQIDKLEEIGREDLKLKDFITACDDIESNELINKVKFRNRNIIIPKLTRYK